MPIYVFQNGQGAQREMLAPMGAEEIEVDGEKWKRARVLTPFGVNTGAQPTSTRDQVRKGYYRMECEGGRWRSGYSKKQIKKAWQL